MASPPEAPALHCKADAFVRLEKKHVATLLAERRALATALAAEHPWPAEWAGGVWPAAWRNGGEVSVLTRERYRAVEVEDVESVAQAAALAAGDDAATAEAKGVAAGAAKYPPGAPRTLTPNQRRDRKALGNRTSYGFSQLRLSLARDKTGYQTPAEAAAGAAADALAAEQQAADDALEALRAQQAANAATKARADAAAAVAKLQGTVAEREAEIKRTNGLCKKLRGDCRGAKSRVQSAIAAMQSVHQQYLESHAGRKHARDGECGVTPAAKRAKTSSDDTAEIVAHHLTAADPPTFWVLWTDGSMSTWSWAKLVHKDELHEYALEHELEVTTRASDDSSSAEDSSSVGEGTASREAPSPASKAASHAPKTAAPLPAQLGAKPAAAQDAVRAASAGTTQQL